MSHEPQKKIIQLLTDRHSSHNYLFHSGHEERARHEIWRENLAAGPTLDETRLGREIGDRIEVRREIVRRVIAPAFFDARAERRFMLFLKLRTMNMIQNSGSVARRIIDACRLCKFHGPMQSSLSSGSEISISLSPRAKLVQSRQETIAMIILPVSALKSNSHDGI